jgi:hypothetical protein
VLNIPSLWYFTSPLRSHDQLRTAYAHQLQRLVTERALTHFINDIFYERSIILYNESPAYPFHPLPAIENNVTISYRRSRRIQRAKVDDDQMLCYVGHFISLCVSFSSSSSSALPLTVPGTLANTPTASI